MTEYNYNQWDKERRETWPNGIHYEWETLDGLGGERLAGFDDIECWVLPKEYD